MTASTRSRRTTATRPSRSSISQPNKVVATLEAGPDMTGVNFAAGKAFVISSTSGFVYVYNMSTLKPAGRIKIGTNIQLETATTDTADQKLYLAESTNQFRRDHRREDRSRSKRVATSGCIHGARTSWTARTTTATDADASADRPVQPALCPAARRRAGQPRPQRLGSGRSRAHSRPPAIAAPTVTESQADRCSR